MQYIPKDWLAHAKARVTDAVGWHWGRAAVRSIAHERYEKEPEYESLTSKYHAWCGKIPVTVSSNVDSSTDHGLSASESLSNGSVIEFPTA